MQRRNKVGGILDRRFGENDPTMAPEDKMLERFAREKQKTHKKNSLFDLEEDEPSIGLTHGGESLKFDGPGFTDDFDENDLGSGDESDASMNEKKRMKRARLMEMLENGADAEEGEGDTDQPEKKKTRQEVMQEVIAKSKLHKYERQATREENDDLREELDKELPNIKELLWSTPGVDRSGAVDDAPSGFMPGIDRKEMEKNFDIQLKKMAMDKRAQPSKRTKSEEELAEERQSKLKELEEKRQRRMRGEAESSESEEESDKEDDAEKDKKDVNAGGDLQMIPVEEEEDYGLGQGIKARRPTATELGLDDEDDFLIEDDLVASGSDIDPADEEEESSDEEDGDSEDEEDDFTKGLLSREEEANPEFEDQTVHELKEKKGGDEHGIPYTFPCPQSLDELLEIMKPHPREKLPVIIQRIRALYHPRLDSKNKERLGAFSRALVDFISVPVDSTVTPFSVMESVIRHLHSLAKSFAIDIAGQFRTHISEMASSRPTNLHTGDLIALTAVGSIFPTSDHFHQVVTPAILCMARYLGQKIPRTIGDYATGAFLGILTIQYQQFAKRYVPELMNFCLNTLCALAPAASNAKLGDFPLHTPAAGMRITGTGNPTVRKLAFGDCTSTDVSAKDAESAKVSIVSTIVQVLEVAADTWASKPALYETLEPASRVLKHLTTKPNRTKLPAPLNEVITKAHSKLSRTLKIAELSRRTLTLHHHRPLAIKSHVPKFEERFDPTKHYDPDKERAELAKLKAEHKRERKGALRELRKDANFMAREKLRAKKIRDEAYENKFRKIVAEIQGEEGRESNEYDREKRARKRARTTR